jgi:hypothetical protein
MQDPIKTENSQEFALCNKSTTNQNTEHLVVLNHATTNQKTEEPFAPHCTKNPIYVFPENELRGLSPNSYILCL